MKTFALFLCATLLFSVSIFAQQLTTTGLPSMPAKMMLSGTRSTDTIKGPVFYTGYLCADTMTYSNIGTGFLTGNGYITQGTSHLPLTECSQTMDNASSNTITGVTAIIKKISGTTGSIGAKIYTVDGTFKPITTLGTSNTINTSSLNLGVNKVTFTFSPAISVTSNFAVSIVYPTTAGDTIVVYSTKPGCVDAAKNSYAYVYISSVGWYSYKSYMAISSKGSFDLFIYALKFSTTNIKENSLNDYIDIYPNPADNNITIASSNKIGKIRVMNCLGETIFNEDINTLLYYLNTSSMKTGIYIIQIETEKGTICKKITINR